MTNASHEQPEPGILIDLRSLPNLRDIGGYPVASGGRVRTGRLYRSVALDRLTPPDAEVLRRFEVRTVFDLRTEHERTAAPDRLPEGAAAVVCDVLAEATAMAPAELLDVVQHPARAAEALGGGKAVEMFRGAYREIVSSGSALRAYRTFFLRMAEADAPALVHCTTGKDRTGWASAATLMLLGAEEEHVFYDYELTNRYLLPRFDALFAQFAADGGDPEILKPVLGVDPDYLRTAIDEMTARFGSVRGYFSDGLGIDADAQERIRQSLIE